MCDKAFNIVKNPKNDGYQTGFPSMVYKFVDKKTSARANKNEITSNKELAEELHKPLIRTFKNRTSRLTFYRQYLGFWPCWYGINK